MIYEKNGKTPTLLCPLHILKGGKQLLATDFSSDDANVTLSNINLKQDLANRQQTHINVSLSNITL